MRAPVVLTLLAFGLTACGDGAPTPTDMDVVTIEAFANGNGANARNFRTHARGDEEVDPVDTDAQGQAIFQLSKDGEELSYKLIVANIENVLMAHIHLAPAGQNGGIVVWLYPSGPPPQPIPGRFQGVLAEGVIDGDDLVGDLEGEGLDALVAEMRAGNTYVNVHTEQHPGGEVRGQVH